jgi:hypothetical protein
MQIEKLLLHRENLSVIQTPYHIPTSTAFEALLMRTELLCFKSEPPEMPMGTYDRANYVKLASASHA